MQTQSVEARLTGEAGKLDRLSQAAIILLSIGETHAAAVLRCLTRDELLQVTQAMSIMGGVKVESVTQALDAFFSRFREQSSIHGGSRVYLQRTLDLALGSDIATTVLDALYGDRIRHKIALLQWASPRWLAQHISNEDVRMQALFLAFLPPVQASEVVEQLPLESRDAVLVNVAKLDDVDRKLLVELEEIIELCLINLDLQGATVEGARQAPSAKSSGDAHWSRLWRIWIHGASASFSSITSSTSICGRLRRFWV